MTHLAFPQPPHAFPVAEVLDSLVGSYFDLTDELTEARTVATRLSGACLAVDAPDGIAGMALDLRTSLSAIDTLLMTLNAKLGALHYSINGNDMEDRR